MDSNNKSIVFYCKKCGGIIMAMVNNPGHLKDSTREIASAIKQGYPLDIISNEEVRSAAWCACNEKD